MKEKFVDIFNKYCDDIYRLAYSYTNSKDDSEDIVQSVFMKYLDNMDNISNDYDAIKKWLIVVTINKSKDLFKSSWKKRIVHYDDEVYKNLFFCSVAVA